MAKGARSNHKKAVRTQRRLTLKASWQEEADQRRYAVLAEAAAAEPLPIVFHQPSEDTIAQDEARARTRQASKDAMETDAKAPLAAGRKRKGIKVSGGVQKTRHNKKKQSALWVSNQVGGGGHWVASIGCPHDDVMHSVWAAHHVCIASSPQVSNFHKSKKGKEGFQ